MKRTTKDYIVVLFFSMALGVVCGSAIWAFLLLMEYGIEFLWIYLPERIDSPYYVLTVCILGSIVVGLIHRAFGDYPEEMTVVMTKIKRDGYYDYRKVPIYAISAFVPLILGASIGPEAGLVGLIAGLCSFVKHKFALLNRQFADVANVGFSAALAVVFHSPLFGFIEPLEDDDFDIPKRNKTVLYFTVILAAFGIFLILDHYIPSPGTGITQIIGYSAGKWEWIMLIPCVITGYLGGFLFLFSEKYLSKAYALLGKRHIIKALIGGLMLGISGTVLPYTMFSGESQIGEIASTWHEIGVVVLIITGFVKLFLTASCISSGFKGGHFFPAIFAGISVGFGLSLILGINSAFSCAAVTAALVASILRKPVASALLLLLCFPLDSVLVLLIGSVSGILIPMPRMLIHSKPCIKSKTPDSQDPNLHSEGEHPDPQE